VILAQIHCVINNIFTHPGVGIIVIVWFRQDLRLQDNPALRAAAAHSTVLPVYILDDVNSGQWRMGGASRWWLHHSLISLNRSLQGNLLVLEGDPLQLIPALARDNEASAVYWNRCYEPWRTTRDSKLKSSLQAQGIKVQSFNGSLLWEPWQINKSDGNPYRVFTPYYRKGCLKATPPPFPEGAPSDWSMVRDPGASYNNGIKSLNLLPTIPWDKPLASTWQIGESAAQKQLQHFLDKRLTGYREGRDFPAKTSVSRLSPYLHFGEISPRQVWHEAMAAGTTTGTERDLDHFLSELGWREFSVYLLYHNPDLPEKNHQQKFNNFPWQNVPDLLHAWQKGQTGYPLIDAGMRELWQTGYMHNRVRMVVASFLVKNLGLHWREGEKWFWDTLVDADLASNSASWQWVAGSGADAAPFFRIFNPVTQGKKFDPRGEYIRRFVPELASLPDRHIHNPSEAPDHVLTQAGVQIGRNYPAVIVDLKQTREAALKAFKSL